MASDPDAFDGLARYGLTNPEAFLSQFVARGDAIRDAVADAPVNTLAHPRYEFFSLRDYAVPIKQRVASNIDLIARLRRAAGPDLLEGMRLRDDAEAERLRRAAEAEQAYLAGYRTSLRPGPISAPEIFERYDEALALAPWNDSLRARIYFHYSEIADSQQRTWVKADLMRRALAAYDGSAQGHLEYSRLLGRLHETEPALEAARRAVELDPDLPAARRTLAQLLLRAGKPAEAQSHLQALRDLDASGRGR
jgi:tetratricopeptide (TPR) repeat protein